MKKTVQTLIMNIAGWFFVLLGVIGAFLPLMPTTVFLIIALFLFAKSSPRFHRMLLENRWFGPGLRQWEQNKTVTRQTKHKATTAILITFILSIAVLYQRPYLQLMLLAIAGLLLAYIWRLREIPVKTADS